jgi:hypothetical protein
MGPVVHPKQLEMTFNKGYSYGYKEVFTEIFLGHLVNSKGWCDQGKIQIQGRTLSILSTLWTIYIYNYLVCEISPYYPNEIKIIIS